MGSQGAASQVQSKKKKLPSREHHNINPAEIDRKNCTFNTRSFMIRYCEEEVSSFSENSIWTLYIGRTERHLPLQGGARHRKRHNKLRLLLRNRAHVLRFAKPRRPRQVPTPTVPERTRPGGGVQVHEHLEVPAQAPGRGYLRVRADCLRRAALLHGLSYDSFGYAWFQV